MLLHKRQVLNLSFKLVHFVRQFCRTRPNSWRGVGLTLRLRVLARIIGLFEIFVFICVQGRYDIYKNGHCEIDNNKTGNYDERDEEDWGPGFRHHYLPGSVTPSVHGHQLEQRKNSPPQIAKIVGLRLAFIEQILEETGEQNAKDVEDKYEEEEDAPHSRHDEEQGDNKVAHDLDARNKAEGTEYSEGADDLEVRKSPGQGDYGKVKD